MTAQPNVTCELMRELPAGIQEENWFASDELVEASKEATAHIEEAYTDTDARAAKIMADMFDSNLTLRTANDFSRMSLMMAETASLVDRAKEFHSAKPNLAARRRALVISATAIGLEQ